jgi:hypothetical protein
MAYASRSPAIRAPKYIGLWFVSPVLFGWAIEHAGAPQATFEPEPNGGRVGQDMRECGQL